MSSLIYNYELIKRKKLTVSNKHKKQLVYLVQFKNKYDIKEIKKYLQDCFNRPIKKKENNVVIWQKFLKLQNLIFNDDIN